MTCVPYLQNRSSQPIRPFSVWLLFLLLATGCFSRTSEDRAVDEALSSLGEARLKVFPLAGKVTIDGQPPQSSDRRKKILVVLNDATKPDQHILERPVVVCSPSGEFAFHTYAERDGVPAGEYVLTFVQFLDRGKRGYFGPDGFKNLYSDPQKQEFRVSHQEPGRGDYVFDLKIEGRQSVPLGAKALRPSAETTDRR